MGEEDFFRGGSLTQFYFFTNLLVGVKLGYIPNFTALGHLEVPWKFVVGWVGCVVGVVDIPIIIITLHPVELSWFELRVDQLEINWIPLSYHIWVQFSVKHLYSNHHQNSPFQYESASTFEWFLRFINTTLELLNQNIFEGPGIPVHRSGC